MSVRTYKQIIEQAKKCRSNVEKNYTLGISSKWGYYFAKQIVNPRKNVTRKSTLKVAPKPRGDYISRQIPKADYKQLAKNLIAFCEKNNRLPNYLTYKGVRIRARLYIYMFAWVLVYYNKNEYFPHNVNVNYKVFYPPKPTPSPTTYDYIYDEGCAGIGQCNGYFCACNSLQQAFHKLTDIHISEYTIGEWAGTGYEGTDHDSINTAVAQFNRKYGTNIKIDWYNFSDLGWNKFAQMVRNGAVFCHINYRDQWGHYEIVKSVGDDDLEVLNSLGDRCGDESYCGYKEVRDKSTQLRYMNGISQKSVAYLHTD